MDIKTCPNCKVTTRANPKMIIKINECGHILCDNCISVEYKHGQGKCYACGKLLKLQHWRILKFDDPKVDKDIHIRKKILKKFYRPIDDFASTSEYQRFQSYVESLIYNLTNDIDVDQTNLAIKQYEMANQDTMRKYEQAFMKNIYDKRQIAMKYDQLDTQTRERFIKEDKDELLSKMQAQQDNQLLDRISNERNTANQIILEHQLERKREAEKQMLEEKLEATRIAEENAKRRQVLRGGNIKNIEIKTTEEEGWDWENDWKRPKLQADKSPQLRQKDEILNFGYLNNVNINPQVFEWTQGVDSCDRLSIAQRQLNDAFCCL